jgi:hypothetical protein
MKIVKLDNDKMLQEPMKRSFREISTELVGEAPQKMGR